jgi:hypothetical protein
MFALDAPVVLTGTFVTAEKKLHEKVKSIKSVDLL